MLVVGEDGAGRLRVSVARAWVICGSLEEHLVDGKGALRGTGGGAGVGVGRSWTGRVSGGGLVDGKVVEGGKMGAIRGMARGSVVVIGARSLGRGLSVGRKEGRVIEAARSRTHARGRGRKALLRGSGGGVTV